MIVYEPLWKTMKEKKVSQYLLIKTYGISCGQLDRLTAGEVVQGFKNRALEPLDVGRVGHGLPHEYLAVFDVLPGGDDGLLR